jgi:hypothetical protein
MILTDDCWHCVMKKENGARWTPPPTLAQDPPRLGAFILSDIHGLLLRDPDAMGVHICVPNSLWPLHLLRSE